MARNLSIIGDMENLQAADDQLTLIPPFLPPYIPAEQLDKV